ncbi:MAG: hypothetical protein HQK83_02620 [Fibrobacteria bacterium]|nr:hypothetical protein [Fibrobacteria bacterium]
MVVFIWSGLCAYCDTVSDISSKIRKHFEWGEYDSLIIELPAVLLNDNLKPEPKQKANFLKYLGLANFMKGDTTKASLYYLKALNLQGDINLDSFFVDKKATDFFLSIKKNWSNKHLSNTEHPLSNSSTDSVQLLKMNTTTSPLPSSHNQETPEHQNRAGTTLQKPSTFPRQSFWNTGKVIGITTFAAAGIVGYLSYRQYRLGEENYQAVQDASALGLTDLRREKEEDLKRNDTMTLMYGGGAMLLTGLSLFFFFWNNTDAPLYPDDTAFQIKYSPILVPSAMHTFPGFQIQIQERF